MEVAVADACSEDVEALPSIGARVPTVVTLSVAGKSGQPGGVFLLLLPLRRSNHPLIAKPPEPLLAVANC
jgi:hypothetical protein